MKYVVEMSSGDMMYISSFITFGLGIQKLIRGGDTQTHRHDGNRISLLLFI